MYDFGKKFIQSGEYDQSRLVGEQILNIIPDDPKR
jgi:hypothetical protein